MKFWHQKFLENELKVKNNIEPLKTSDNNKMTYLFHQFIIWISIFSILFLILKFLKMNTNLINV